jgi:hypothetical protein
MKKPFVVFLVVVAALGAIALFAPTRVNARPSCGTVRCLPCPDGYHLSLQWPDCCRCVRD